MAKFYHSNPCEFCAYPFSSATPRRQYCSLRCAVLSGIHIRGSDVCWLWCKATNPKGYGQFKFQGRLYTASRAIWELINGHIPQGILICHHCDNPTCMNPGHLFSGTPEDNMSDCYSKGRHPQKGEANGHAILTEQDAIIILSSTESGVTLAKQYGVSPSAICDIRRHKRWKHI